MTEEQKPSMTETEPDARPQEPAGEAIGSTSPEQAETGERLEVVLKDMEVLKDQLKRKAAEFENYKRRMEAEIRNIIENATERLIIDLLPILDDFDRFQQSGKENGDLDVLKKGVDLIAQKMKKVLEFRGLTSFESKGKPFDVHYHDALAHIPQSDVPPNTVIEEVNRGYSLNDKVIRHARVVVSAPTDSEPHPAADANATNNDGSPQ
jgi:molecular chaperone GrpE